MESLKKQFKNWTKLDYAWLIIANAVILGLSLYWQDSIISIISAITGVTCVIFVSKGMMANYIVGAINVALYAYLAFKSRIYGDFMLNAFYYFPMQFIGLYMWSKAKGKSETHEIESKALDHKQRIILFVVSICIILAYAEVLKYLGGNVPIIDSTSTVLSVIAMILMVKQYLEQWYLWVIVNIVSIVMWIISLSEGSGDAATLIMWILFLLNSLYGLWNWKKEYEKQNKK